MYSSFADYSENPDYEKNFLSLFFFKFFNNLK